MNKHFVRGLAGLASVVAVSAANAADETTALAALQSLSTSAVGFGPVLFGLAVTSVGIMIGVKWIKRGRGAS